MSTFPLAELFTPAPPRKGSWLFKFLQLLFNVPFFKFRSQLHANDSSLRCIQLGSESFTKNSQKTPKDKKQQLNLSKSLTLINQKKYKFFYTNALVLVLFKCIKWSRMLAWQSVLLCLFYFLWFKWQRYPTFLSFASYFAVGLDRIFRRNRRTLSDNI